MNDEPTMMNLPAGSFEIITDTLKQVDLDCVNNNRSVSDTNKLRRAATRGFITALKNDMKQNVYDDNSLLEYGDFEIDKIVNEIVTEYNNNQRVEKFTERFDTEYEAAEPTIEDYKKRVIKYQTKITDLEADAVIQRRVIDTLQREKSKLTEDLSNEKALNSKLAGIVATLEYEVARHRSRILDGLNILKKAIPFLPDSHTSNIKNDAKTMFASLLSVYQTEEEQEEVNN